VIRSLGGWRFRPRLPLLRRPLASQVAIKVRVATAFIRGSQGALSGRPATCRAAIMKAIVTLPRIRRDRMPVLSCLRVHSRLEPGRSLEEAPSAKAGGESSGSSPTPALTPTANVYHRDHQAGQYPAGPTQRPYLTDFGLAPSASKTWPASGRSRRNRCTGAEQVRGEGGSDRWRPNLEVSVVLYELLTGAGLSSGRKPRSNEQILASGGPRPRAKSTTRFTRFASHLSQSHGNR